MQGFPAGGGVCPDLERKIAQAVCDFAGQLSTGQPGSSGLFGLSGCLAQCWLPQNNAADGSLELYTQGVPFCVSGKGDLLSLFRCVSCKYKFSTDITKPCEMGAIGRVYASGEPEMSHNVQSYDARMYLRIVEARRCRVHGTMFMPLFASVAREQPCGVFEVVLLERDVLFPALVEILQNTLERSQLYTAIVEQHSMGIGLRRCPPDLDSSARKSASLRAPTARRGESASREPTHCSTDSLHSGAGRACKRPRADGGSQEGASAQQPRPGAAAASATQLWPLPPQQQGQPQQQQQVHQQATLLREGLGGSALHGLLMGPRVELPSNLAGLMLQQLPMGSMAHGGGLLPGRVDHGLEVTADSEEVDPGGFNHGSTSGRPQRSAGPDHITSARPGSAKSKDASPNRMSRPNSGRLVSKGNRLELDTSDAPAPMSNSNHSEKLQGSHGVGVGRTALAMPQQQQPAASPAVVAPNPFADASRAAACSEQPADKQQPGQARCSAGAVAAGARPRRACRQQQRYCEADDDLDSTRELAAADGSREHSIKQELEPETGSGAVAAGSPLALNNRSAGGAGKRLALADLQSQFGIGLRKAAANLRICPTTLKRACRRHGIKRWPSRQQGKKDRPAGAPLEEALSSGNVSCGVTTGEQHTEGVEPVLSGSDVQGQPPVSSPPVDATPQPTLLGPNLSSAGAAPAPTPEAGVLPQLMQQRLLLMQRVQEQHPALAGLLMQDSPWLAVVARMQEALACSSGPRQQVPLARQSAQHHREDTDTSDSSSMDAFGFAQLGVKGLPPLGSGLATCMTVQQSGAPPLVQRLQQECRQQPPQQQALQHQQQQQAQQQGINPSLSRPLPAMLLQQAKAQQHQALQGAADGLHVRAARPLFTSLESCLTSQAPLQPGLELFPDHHMEALDMSFDPACLF